MGFSHLNSFFGNILGFGISGYLLNAWCPDPKTLSTEIQAEWALAISGKCAMPQVYANAHYIWYVFAGIGAAAFFALMIFNFYTANADRNNTE